MAKKKDAHQPKQPQEDSLKPQEHTHQPNPMDDPSEKILALKSLNAILLKETHERRQQVDALEKSKRVLESELTRSDSEREALGAELYRVSDELVGFEFERGLMDVVMVTQMGEMGVDVERLAGEMAAAERRLVGLEAEVDKVRREKEVEVKDLNEKVAELMMVVAHEKEVSRFEMIANKQKEHELNAIADQVKSLTQEVANLEEKEMNYVDELRKFKLESERLIQEKKEKESLIESLKAEKDGIERNLNEKVAELMKDIANVREVLRVVASERDQMKHEMNLLSDQSNGLRKEVAKLELREVNFVDEVRSLKAESEILREEKNKKESIIELLRAEKVMLDWELEESVQVIEDLKSQTEEITRKNEDAEGEIDGQVLIIKKLESEVNELNVNALVWHKENEKLHGEVLELVRHKDDLLVKKKQMQMEFDVLKEQNKENEKKLDMLLEEKSMAFNEYSSELEAQMQKIEGLIREKNEMAEQKSVLEIENVELKKCCEATEIKLEAERNDMKKCLEEERISTRSLCMKLSEMELKIELGANETKQMRSELEDLTEAKNVLETQLELSMKEKDSLHKSLKDAHQEIKTMMSETESARYASEAALTMLKKTAATICLASDGTNGEIYTGEENSRREIAPYVAELETIRNAFKSKDLKVEDMKRQFELLHISLVEAHNKRKSFWTLVTSAATICAAASVAYVARGR